MKNRKYTYMYIYRSYVAITVDFYLSAMHFFSVLQPLKKPVPNCEKKILQNSGKIITHVMCKGRKHVDCGYICVIGQTPVIYMTILLSLCVTREV